MNWRRKPGILDVLLVRRIISGLTQVENKRDRGCRNYMTCRLAFNQTSTLRLRRVNLVPVSSPGNQRATRGDKNKTAKNGRKRESVCVCVCVREREKCETERVSFVGETKNFSQWKKRPFKRYFFPFFFFLWLENTRPVIAAMCHAILRKYLRRISRCSRGRAMLAFDHENTYIHIYIYMCVISAQAEGRKIKLLGLLALLLDDDLIILPTTILPETEVDLTFDVKRFPRFPSPVIAFHFTTRPDKSFPACVWRIEFQTMGKSSSRSRGNARFLQKSCKNFCKKFRDCAAVKQRRKNWKTRRREEFSDSRRNFNYSADYAESMTRWHRNTTATASPLSYRKLWCHRTLNVFRNVGQREQLRRFSAAPFSFFFALGTVARLLTTRRVPWFEETRLNFGNFGVCIITHLLWLWSIRGNIK